MNKIIFDELDSTNTYAKERINDLADRTVIVAKRQSKGKGTRGRSWVDLGEGNLFVSIVLKPSNIFDDKYIGLTVYFSNILCDLLKEYEIKAQIKAPNDVLVYGKKIAGVLNEAVTQGANFKGMVLGFGVNLNASDFSLIVDQDATALSVEIGKTIDAELFLDRLLEKFFAEYDARFVC